MVDGIGDKLTLLNEQDITKVINTELNFKEHELLLQKLKEENIYCSPDDAPRSITKPDGRVIKLATFGSIKSAFTGGA